MIEWSSRFGSKSADMIVVWFIDITVSWLAYWTCGLRPYLLRPLSYFSYSSIILSPSRLCKWDSAFTHPFYFEYSYAEMSFVICVRKLSTIHFLVPAISDLHSLNQADYRNFSAMYVCGINLLLPIQHSELARVCGVYCKTVLLHSMGYVSHVTLMCQSWAAPVLR